MARAWCILRDMQVVSVAATVVLLLSAHAARGATPRVVVIAPAIDGCITNERLQERIQLSWGKQESPPELVLQVDIEREAAGLRAHLGWIDHGQVAVERSLQTTQSRCEELDAALVLVATTLLEELRAETSPAVEGAGGQPDAPPPAPPPPEPPPAVAPTRAQPPRERSAPAVQSAPAAEHDRWRSSVAGGVGVAGGTLPDTTFSPRLDLRIALRQPWAVWFGAEASPSGSTQRVESSRIEFAGAMATLAACYAPLVTTRVIVDGCLGMMGGAIITTGSNVQGSPDKARPLISPIAAVAFSAPIFGPVLLRGHVAGGVALVRDDYFLTDSSGVRQVVRRAESSMGEAALGIGFLL